LGLGFVLGFGSIPTPTPTPTPNNNFKNLYNYFIN